MEPTPEGTGGNTSGTATPGGTGPPVYYPPRSDAQGLRDFQDATLVDTGGPISGLGGQALGSGASREEALRLNENNEQAVATGDNAFGNPAMSLDQMHSPAAPGASPSGILPGSSLNAPNLARPEVPNHTPELSGVVDPQKSNNQILSPGNGPSSLSGGAPGPAGGGGDAYGSGMTSTDRDQLYRDLGINDAQVAGLPAGTDLSSGTPRSTVDKLHGTDPGTVLPQQGDWAASSMPSVGGIDMPGLGKPIEPAGSTS